MKSRISLMTLMCMPLLLAACIEGMEPVQPEPIPEEKPSSLSVTLISDIESSRLAAPDGVEISKSFWYGGEKLALWLSPKGGNGVNTSYVTLENKLGEANIASFQGTAPYSDGGKDYFALVPADALEASTGTGIKIKVPVEQVWPEQSVPDPATGIMLSKPGSAQVSGSKLNIKDVTFDYGVSLLQVAVDASAVSHLIPDGASLSGIRIEATTGIAGSYEIGIASRDPLGEASENSVSATLSTPVEFKDGKAFMYLALARVSVPAQKLSFTISTSCGTITAVRSLTKALDLAAGPEKVVVSLISFDSFALESSTVWYVSPKGSDNNDGMSPEKPFQTLKKAISKLKPGHTLKMMGGEYKAPAGSRNIMVLRPGNSGTEGAYIYITAYDPADPPRLHGTGNGVWECIDCGASYVIIDGLEVYGDVQKLDSLEAYQDAYKHYMGETSDWYKSARFNTNGISIGDVNNNKDRSLHVTIRNCKVHDLPGGGIGASNSDYITVENNIIYNNGWTCMFACSGISFIHPVNSDSNNGHKMIIRGNTVFNNRTMIPWYRGVGQTFKYSDGNGIILDINNRSYDGGPYKGRTLVCNNVTWWNGGSGIHAYSADHVDIVNNTAYMNGRKYANGEYGDIYAHGCTDVVMMNNIMYGRADGDCNKKGKAPNGSDPGIMYYNNLMFNGRTYTGSDYFIDGKIANPLFENPGTTLDADFHLKANSPAVGMGKSSPLVPDTDKDGVSRSGRIDCGAYQLY